ncbi:MAG: OmpA family protein [Planctomycetaceae bacterium]|jgi:chemotaxis protein MotB|nr:OmpA family protein [Planctomycetaceae bacterium]
MSSETEIVDSGMSDWFLTYGDLMSLLLCFFVMLYAMSTLQVPKIQAAVESFRGGLVKQEQEKQQQEKQEKQKQHENQTTTTTTTTAISQGNKTCFQTTYSDEKSVKGGVIRFAVNSDELNDETKRHLNLLIEELSGVPFKILITGHAEPDEQGTYRDSMDLSYSRAVNVWRYFVSKGMNQDDFRIHAAGSSEPIEMEEMGSQLINMCADIKIIANTFRNEEKKNVGNNLKYLRF